MIPKHLEVMRSITGTVETPGAGDNPAIMAWPRAIAERYPDMAAYCAQYTHDEIAWCGLTVAYCMAMAGIRPVFGLSDTDKFLWAQAWKQFGTHVSDERFAQPGDVVVFARHVSLFERFEGSSVVCRGGNQSDQVKESKYPVSSIEAVLAPPSVQADTQPAKQINLDAATIAEISAVAASSELAGWNWSGRGRAPIGYVQGMAVSYAQALVRLAAGDSVSRAMVRFVDGPNDHDVFDHYQDQILASGLATDGAPDIDRLRALWVILTGLGMRESSGGQDIGRDQSASNTSADTAEAGAWQQSWNSRIASPELPKLLDAYIDMPPDAVDAIFMTGVTLRPGAMDSFGGGAGRTFQDLAKMRPSFAVQAAALGARTLYPHWGPLVRREVEIVPAADALFQQIQSIVEGAIVMAEPTEQPKPPVNPIPQPKPAQPQVPAVLSPKLDVLQGLHYIVSGQRDKVREDLKLFLDVFNSKHPDAAIALPAAPAPAPSSGSLLDRPSVQLGGIGLAATGILHTIGMLDPNLTLLAGIVSVATAALGPAGGIVGKIIMNIARSAMAASQNKDGSK